MTTRSTRTEPDGTVLLTLRGERGAAQAIIMQRPFETGDRPGVLGLHSLAPAFGMTPGECDVLPGGACYGDAAYRAGFEVASLYDQGLEEQAWAVIEDWYQSRIEQEA